MRIHWEISLVDSTPSDGQTRLADAPLNETPASRTVLIVDDYEANRYLRGRTLRSAGFRVIEASTGMEALELAVREQPALIVLDVRLPDLNGFEVCRRLKSDPVTRWIAVLHVSAVGQVEHDLPEALENQSDAYLREPVEAETLVAIANALIRAREAERREFEAEEGARTAILEASELSRSLIQASTDCINLLDLDAHLLYMSEGGQKLLEIEDFRRLVNASWLDFWKGSDGDAARTAVEAAKAGGVGHFRGCCPTWKGTAKWWDVVITPITGLDGKTERLLAISRDVTEEKQAEEQLHDTLESIGDGFVACDADWRFVYVNAAAERILNLRREEMLGKSHRQVFPQTRGTHLESEYRRAAADGQGRDFEYFHEPWQRWFHTRCFPRRGGGMSVYFQDITAQKQAEQALGESEERFRTMADNISQFAWMANPDGSVFWYNRRWYEYTGTTFEEVQGWGWRKVHHPDHVARVVERIQRSFETGEPWEDTFPLRGKEGGYRWFLSHALPIRDSEGRVTRWFGTSTDITEHLETEQRLRQSEQRYRGLFESMQEGFVIGEVIRDEAGEPVDWRYREVNPAMAAMLGHSREEVVGHTYRELFPEASWQYWVEGFGRVAITGKSARREGYGAGTQRYYDAIIQSPEPGQFAAILTDITHRQRSEEALRESEARERARAAELEAILEAVPAAVFIAQDVECRTIMGSRMTYEMLRLPPGSNVSVSAPEDQRPTNFRVLRGGHEIAPQDLPVQKAAATGQPVRNCELEFVFEEGGSRDLLGDAVPLFDEHGQPRGAVGAFIDITERKRHEERLRQAQKLESVGLLAGGIAHDFNNLLTGIMGNASMVLDEVSPSAAERIREVMSSAERAANLTRQLLAYSGKGRFIVRDLDVSEAVNEIGSLVEFSIPKSAQLSLNVQRRLPAVRMDPSQLQQILMNLVINAGEAIGEGSAGKITVATSMIDIETPFVDGIGEEIQPGRYVCIEVADTGPGIDAGKRSRIFDPFFTTKFTGRGLGLAAVAGILRSQKGGIAVESAPGQGSTFRVFLPVSRRQAAVEPPGGARLVTIMVVDDETSVREFIAAALRRQGYGVATASDGREALSVWERENGAIDGLILDVVMPVMGGNELLPELKRRRPDLKVLLTSGYSEEEARRLCAAYPGATFIQKPYTAQQIVKVVDRMLAKPAARAF